MFTNVGWTEILLLGVVALVVLGPERLPEAARWLAATIRKVKEFAGNAQQQLKDDYGADFEEFSEPLKQLNDLRGLSPRAMVTKHLLDGDDSLFSGNFDAAAPAGGTASSRSAGLSPQSSPAPQSYPAPQSTAGPRPAAGPVSPNPVPPSGGAVWDSDAT